MQRRPLFGGAISAVIPERFRDISAIRDVPDNQEVFVDVDRDDSAIVELLELLSDVPDANAAQFHFAELAASNDATGPGLSMIEFEQPMTAVQIPLIGLSASGAAGATAAGLIGRQRVSKGREGDSARNDVRIYLAVIRLPAVGTDVVITVNEPVAIAPSSSSAVSTGAAAPSAPALAAADGAVAGPFPSAGPALPPGFAEFMTLLQSFTIHDWGLFQ